MATESKFVDLTLSRGLALMAGDADTEKVLQQTLFTRISGVETEHSLFRTMADRWDALYYSTTFFNSTGGDLGGADLFPEDITATTPGRAHVSVNTPASYVDIPAALQSYKPIENMLATEDSTEARTAAAAMERIYSAWKAQDKFELKFHKAATLKSLYGRTAGFVYFDRAKDYPCLDVIQNPRNLWLGYKSDDYDVVEWAAHVELMDPIAVTERYSIEFEARAVPDQMGAGSGKIVPWAIGMANRPRPEMNWGPARVEVWDYWYRKPADKKPGKMGDPTRMETWNVIVVGNLVVKNVKYDEYDGAIPYVPLFNTFIPGTPSGRSELHDAEPLIREKMTRITAGAEMIRKATAGDYWQLIGENVPLRGSAGVKPKLNETVSPGPGNRIEAITPFIAQFQLEQFFGRLDRELAVITGLNDLLLGLAPTATLNSSKAINALISNYETRLAMRRLLFYTWRRDVWELVVKVYAKRKKEVRDVVAAGGGILDIIDPSLSPRDELETANRALSLVGGKLWSQRRGMDAVGVDDPEVEQELIREESTDATLWPERVQLMAQLMGALQSLGIQPPAGAQSQAQGQIASGQNDLATALGAGQLQKGPGQQGPEAETPPPPGSQTPGASPDANAPFAQGQAAAGGTQLQGMIQNGKVSGRILTKQNLGRK